MVISVESLLRERKEMEFHPKLPRRWVAISINIVCFGRSAWKKWNILSKEMRRTVSNSSMDRKIFTLVLMVLFSAEAIAKRVAPEKVPPVATDSIVYSVPHFPEGQHNQKGGVVEAHDPRTGKLLWQIQIYKTEYNPEMEQDVQDVFIKTLTLDKVHNLLIMSDDKARVYVLHLQTKKVVQVHE